jgi:hypothetical protein
MNIHLNILDHSKWYNIIILIININYPITIKFPMTPPDIGLLAAKSKCKLFKKAKINKARGR